MNNKKRKKVKKERKIKQYISSIHFQTTPFELTYQLISSAQHDKKYEVSEKKLINKKSSQSKT